MSISPDSAAIAFAQLDETHSTLSVMNIDGSGQKTLLKNIKSDNPSFIIRPKWQPSGKAGPSKTYPV